MSAGPRTPSAEASPDPARSSGVDSPLHRTAATTVTDYWNDSCSVEELTYAIKRGAVGATTNPTIVGDVLKNEMHLWRERITEIVDQHPTWSEAEEFDSYGATAWTLRGFIDSYHDLVAVIRDFMLPDTNVR